MSDGTLKSLPVEELPVTLPEVADYQPSEMGEPPLARNQDFVNYRDQAQRETDTMPGSAGSSWYFLRYTDPHNNEQAFDFDKQKYWMPVDLYVGGAEHTVGHLLYSRFCQKVLFDCGLVSHDEPFQKLAHQGVVMGPDGFRMSKSRGNVVNPDDVCDGHGADALRVYISFLGPFDKDKPWDPKGIEGVRRFLDRVWRLATNEDGQCDCEDIEISNDLMKTLHKTIQKVTTDIESMSFNTAISAMMILVNDTYKSGQKPRQVVKALAQLLQPFAPHLAEEIWEVLGEKGLVSLAPWPDFDSQLTVDDQVTIGVQVSGKMRGTIETSLDTDESTAVEMAKELHAVSQALENKTIIKVIYKAGKILNIIAK